MTEDDQARKSEIDTIQELEVIEEEGKKQGLDEGEILVLQAEHTARVVKESIRDLEILVHVTQNTIEANPTKTVELMPFVKKWKKQIEELKGVVREEEVK